MCRTSSKEWTIRGVYQTLYAIAGAKRQPHQKIHPDGALRSRARSGPPVSGAGPARAAPPTAACCCPTPRSRARPSGRGLAPPGDERAVPVSPALCFLEAVHRHDGQPQNNCAVCIRTISWGWAIVACTWACTTSGAPSQSHHLQEAQCSCKFRERWQHARRRNQEVRCVPERGPGPRAAAPLPCPTYLPPATAPPP